MRTVAGWLCLVMVSAVLAKDKQQTAPSKHESELDKFLAEAAANQANFSAPAPGSLYIQGAPMLDLAADLRARRVNDLVTIVVLDRASAVARGATKSARTTAAQASIN